MKTNASEIGLVEKIMLEHGASGGKLVFLLSKTSQTKHKNMHCKEFFIS